MQLLKITNTPIQYQYEVERAHLEIKQPDIADTAARIKRTEPNLHLRSKNISVQVNTDRMRESMNMRTPTSWARTFAQKGAQAAQAAQGEAAQMGNQMQQIQDGVTIGQIVKSKMLEQPTSYTTFIPSVGPDLTWDPAQLQTQYDPGSTQLDWQETKNVLNYVPGKFSIMVTQYPKVAIEYIGDPMYVPPSANPNYEEPAMQEA